jgi:hypothetical protein
MTAATILVGVLPSYAVWGLAAPLLLVGLRLIQGMIAGKLRLNGPEWLVVQQNLYITLRRGWGWSRSGRRGGAPGKRQDHTEGGKPPART